MTQDFRETKIKIISEGHSRAFQEAVIAAGGGWRGDRKVRNLHTKFLFVSEDLLLTYCDPLDHFEEHEYKEIQFPLTVSTKNVRKDFDKTMKQIIVNVGDLTIEAKQLVSEKLAKITNERGCEPTHWYKTETLYAPSNIGFSYFKSENPTHTPQQVLEMEESAENNVILADTLIITDSSGNLIYDSTLDALNRLIKQRAKSGALPDSGVSVKLDKNGMAVMVEKRKVRTGFDKAKEYSVDVEKCTEEEKEEVQQAFFDVGLPWKLGGKVYRCLDAVQYSNVLTGRGVTTHLLYSDSTYGCNMTAKEFLDLVYEQGHPHVELMLQFAEDAKTTDKPWKNFQWRTRESNWLAMQKDMQFESKYEFRRKPKTHTVNGVEIPDLRVTPKEGEYYYLADPTEGDFTYSYLFHGDDPDKLWVERGLIYQNTDEGRQAAILHAKAMLGITT